MTTGTVRSADGTTIAFDRTGEGPPLIVVLGAFNDRHTKPAPTPAAPPPPPPPDRLTKTVV
jgi:phosphoglycolate phosphatase-like HAD superfamily hydrolase